MFPLYDLFDDSMTSFFQFFKFLLSEIMKLNNRSNVNTPQWNERKNEPIQMNGPLGKLNLSD